MKIDEIQNEIIAEFSGLHDWFDKYRYLIDLGKRYAPPGESFRTDNNAMPGCQSHVWIAAELKENRLHYTVDSDSIIIRGILVLLLRIMDNRSPDEIAHADLFFIERTGLNTSLSPARADGIAAIVKKMRGYGTAVRE